MIAFEKTTGIIAIVAGIVLLLSNFFILSNYSGYYFGGIGIGFIIGLILIVINKKKK